MSGAQPNSRSIPSPTRARKRKHDSGGGGGGNNGDNDEGDGTAPAADANSNNNNNDNNGDRTKVSPKRAKTGDELTIRIKSPTDAAPASPSAVPTSAVDADAAPTPTPTTAATAQHPTPAPFLELLSARRAQAQKKKEKAAKEQDLLKEIFRQDTPELQKTARSLLTHLENRFKGVAPQDKQDVFATISREVERGSRVHMHFLIIVACLERESFHDYIAARSPPDKFVPWVGEGGYQDGILIDGYDSRGLPTKDARCLKFPEVSKFVWWMRLCYDMRFNPFGKYAQQIAAAMGARAVPSPSPSPPPTVSVGTPGTVAPTPGVVSAAATATRMPIRAPVAASHPKPILASAKTRVLRA